MKVTSEQVFAHIQKRPGEKLTFADLATHFNCGDGTLRTLLKSLVDASKIESTGGITHTRNIYKATLYYLKEQPEQAYKTTKPRSLTLAERIMRERCQEMYPAGMNHNTLHANIEQSPIGRTHNMTVDVTNPEGVEKVDKSQAFTILSDEYI